MNIIKLNENIKVIPASIKEIFWKFVRGDYKSRDLESWVYSCHELQEILTDKSYLDIVMIDYIDMQEVINLRQNIYDLLFHYPDRCLCSSFPNYTLLYPFWYEFEKTVFLEHLDKLNPILKIDNFSGKIPIHLSRWYHPAEISKCRDCESKWFVIFEESECDYYLIRLNDDDFQCVLNNKDWPNENWPSALKNWDSFLHIKFDNWHSIYDSKQFLTDYFKI